MSIEHATFTLATLISEANLGSILLPNFQRSYVWRPDAVEKLGASILLGVPCGSILLVTGQNSDFASRKVGLAHSEKESSERQCKFLLDGQQRSSAIRALFSDTFTGDWKASWQETYSSLRNRWSIRIVPGMDDPDLFGYQALRFNGLQPEPELIADAFVQHNIYKTKHLDQWYHPAFESKLGVQARKLQVATYAASAGLVPLWEVTDSGKSDSSSVKIALQRIADDRREELFASFKDGTIDRDIFADLVQHGETWDSLSDDQVRDRLGDRRAEWIQNVLNVIVGVCNFRLGTIELTQDELPKAIAIFEAINRGGTPLTPFDLVTARYARGQSASSLPEMIQERIESFSPLVPKELLGMEGRKWSATGRIALIDDELTTAFKTQFLQVLVMIQLKTDDPSHEFSVDDTKAQRVLALSAADIDANWKEATDAVLSAWRFLQLRCGVKDEGSLRNKLLVLPLAMALRGQSRTKSDYDRVEYWYWASVLTDTYIARQNEHAVRDVNILLHWLEIGANNPFKARGEKILDDEGYSNKETLLRISRGEQVGADVGLYLLQLTLALGGQDIVRKSKLNADSDDLQDHHLVPLGTATSVGQSTKIIRSGKDKASELLNSPLNRVYQSAVTNGQIGAKPIAQYMRELPASVKSSLFLQVDDETFLQARGESYEEHVRGLLGARFEGLKSAIINRMSGLAQ